MDYTQSLHIYGLKGHFSTLYISLNIKTAFRSSNCHMGSFWLTNLTFKAQLFHRTWKTESRNLIDPLEGEWIKR